MNRSLKRLTAMLMVVFMFIAAVPMQMLTAHAATGKITFSDPTVTVGEQVSVKMKIASSDGSALGASDVRLQYDSSALEFVSGTSANGGAGSIRVIGAMESANQTTFAFTLKFKALKAGTTNIKVTSQEVYGANSQVVNIDHVGSSAIKVTAPATYSKDATLSGLTISPGELTPAFSSDVTEYTAVVGADVEKLTVSAPATHGKASVSVNGNEGLQLGDNTITCKVTAEDGETTKTYTILVTKTEELPTEPAEETSAPITSGGSATNVEDGNWQVAPSFDASLLPTGFAVTEFTYDGQAVQAARDEKGNVLLYMINDNGEGDFFLFDASANMLAPYVTVRMAEKQIIVLPPEQIPSEVALPEGFAECTIDIGTHTVHGWIWNSRTQEAPEYCVVFGQNEVGERNFYRYDQKEMTMQRYFQDPDAEDLRAKYTEIAETYTELLAEYKTRGWIIAVLVGVSVLLVVLLLVALIVKKPRKAAAEEKEVKEFIPTERRKVEKAKAPVIETEDDLEEIDLEEEELPEIEEDKVKKNDMINDEVKDEDDDFEFIDLDL
ncbi:MAG: cadherin-like beta sandwich domain-containing protein [Lachnospiraceae bacterium]|nr:cadherin-like beta sandwich domain-containing protein [Lachnospiraceae bacterium]